MVSVIIPVYNGESFLKEAIESIVQQNCEVEIIIVDDGSTDSTREVIKSLPYSNMVYIYQENAGPSKARNTGIKIAKNDFITFLDADDLWPKEKLNKQLSFFNTNAVDVVGGLIQYNYMNGSEYRKEQLNIEDPLFNVQLGALMVKKQLIEKVGFFNEYLRFSEDQDWLLRMRENGAVIHILNEVMLLYRIHDKNITKHKTMKDLGVLKALKLSLDRRRNTGFEDLGSLHKEQ